MRITWIIDNKYRDLYGLYDLKNKLKKFNINLILINKYHWNYAIKLFDPHYVVVPNLYKTSGLPILKFCIKHKIKVILHNVEGFHLDKNSLEIYFPKKYLKYLNKVFTWCPHEKYYLAKIGVPKKKVVTTGSLRYQGEIVKKFPSKIKNIGIISSNKYLSGRFNEENGSNLINQIFRWKDENSYEAKHTVNFMHYEVDFINAMKKIIFSTKKKYNFILRPHPFEYPDFYKNKHFKINKSQNIYDFLKEVDLILNHYSTATIDALKLNVPVISLEKILKDSYKHKALDNFFPLNLSYKVKSINNLKNILEEKSFLKNYKKKYKLKFDKIFNKFHPTNNGINLMLKNFIPFKKKKKFNFFKSLLFFVMYEIYYILKYNRDTAYRFYSFKDHRLLKKFNISND